MLLRAAEYGYLFLLPVAVLLGLALVLGISRQKVAIRRFLRRALMVDLILWVLSLAIIVLYCHRICSRNPPFGASKVAVQRSMVLPPTFVRENVDSFGLGDFRCTEWHYTVRVPPFKANVHFTFSEDELVGRGNRLRDTITFFEDVP